MAKRVDENQRAIVQALRQVGAQVLHLHTLGHGAPDLLVTFQGRLFLLEVKTADGELTPDESQFHLRWPVAVVRSVGDAYVAIGLGRVVA